jgi:hypothetical protein
MKPSVWVKTALFSAFVVLAVAIPTLALAQPRPARFGWQMYSVAQPAPRAWLQSADGSVTEWDLADHLAVLRADISDPESIGQRLCDTEGSAAVLVELRPGALVRVPCG